MAKKRENNKKNLSIGLLRNNATKLKLLLITILLFCCVGTFFHFNPSSFPSQITISTSDLPFCIPSLTSKASQPSTLVHEQAFSNGTIKRFFNPFGSAAYSFVTMGAYRGGLNTFAIIGLSSKPLQVYGNPKYVCEWIPSSMNYKDFTSSSSKPITTLGYKYLPDFWDYCRVYTFVIINCTFSASNDNNNGTGTGTVMRRRSGSSSSSSRSDNVIINEDNNGGKLVLYAPTFGGGGDAKFNVTERIEVLEESPGSIDLSLFEMSSKPKYDYFYCGSPLFGDLSPQRVREWIAYHVKFFGPNSHFVLLDDGGVHEGIMEVLRPWIELGYVTLQDIRDQQRFDGFYRNQLMVLNDCLHRYRFMAKWMFFFDVDEYIYVPQNSTIKTVLDSLSGYSQFTMRQMLMSSKICLSEDYGKSNRKWGFEKLVYRDVTRSIHRSKDRKYALQPRNVYTAGVHLSLNLSGKSFHKTEGKIMYYHYHGAIAERKEPCKILVNSNEVTYDNITYVLDTTMRGIAGEIKKFELKMIGSRLENTRL